MDHKFHDKKFYLVQGKLSIKNKIESRILSLVFTLKNIIANNKFKLIKEKK